MLTVYTFALNNSIIPTLQPGASKSNFVTLFLFQQFIKFAAGVSCCFLSIQTPA